MSKKASKPPKGQAHVTPDVTFKEKDIAAAVNRLDAHNVTLQLKMVFLTFAELDERLTEVALAELGAPEQHFFLAMRAAIRTYHELVSAVEAGAANAPP